MQVYRSRTSGVAPFPLSYYLNNKAPVGRPVGDEQQQQQQQPASPPVDAESTKLQGFTFFECVNFEQGFPILASFLLSGVDPNVTMRDTIGAGALHLAAKAGNILAINFLLDNLADVDLRTRGGQTPLMWAMYKNQTAAASLLLRRGADPKLVDNEGCGLMSFATESPLTLHFLAQHMDVATAAANDRLLHTLCKSKQSRFSVLYCIEQLGLNVNERDPSGKTPLHYAALTGDIDVVKTLCIKGADVSALDERGMRPDAQAGASKEIQSFISRFEAESNNTVRERLAMPDFSNLARLDMKQAKHFAVAFVVPNIIILLGSYLPIVFGFMCLFACAIGFTMVAQFGMAQKGRSLATAGWFLGALCFGGSVVVRQTLPSYAESRPETLVPLAWWAVTVTMFYCYARAVLADPGVVQSTAEIRKSIYDALSVGGEAALQSEGIDITSMVKKPLRSKHCSKTGQCVYRFDHYCVWTGNAIGGGNHRHFVLYCLFQFFSQMLVVYTTVQYLLFDAPRRAGISSVWSGEFASFMVSSENILVTFFLVLYNSFVFMFVSSVLMGQLWFATRNVTSNEVWFPERYKWMFKLGTRAYCLYDNGWRSNLVEFFWSGNLCAELHTVPPMNEYLKGVCQKHAAKVRNQQLHEQNMIQKRSNAADGLSGDQITPGGGPNVGGFDYASAVSQLPESIRREMAIVQSMLQKMISQGSPEGVEVPAEVAADRREHVQHQARTMYQHFQNALSMNRQSAQAPSSPRDSERVSLLADAVDGSDERGGGTVAVDIAPSGTSKRAGRKDE